MEEVLKQAFTDRKVERQTIFLDSNTDIFQKLQDSECTTGVPSGLYSEAEKVLCLGCVAPIASTFRNVGKRSLVQLQHTDLTVLQKGGGNLCDG